MLIRGVFILLVMCLAVVLTPDKVEAQDDNLLNMIEVRSEDGWTNEVSQMVANLNKVDARILRHARNSGVRIILMDVGLTELPEFAHLSGSTPSGWSQTGLTWDEVPGAGGIVTAARIGYSQPGNGHSVINLEIHEFAHAVDDFTAGVKLSHTEEFQQIHSREKNALFYDHVVPYYFDMVPEYFAEAFAMYYYSDSSRQTLNTRAPETYQFIATIKNRLVSIDNTTGNTITLSFTPLSNAVSYNIYRNDELVGNVPAANGQFRDTGLDVSSTYSYFVRAVDANGTEYLTSYYRNASTGDVADSVTETIEEPEVVEEEVPEEVNEEVVEEPEVVEEEVVEEGPEEVEQPEQQPQEQQQPQDPEQTEIPEFTEVTNDQEPEDQHQPELTESEQDESIDAIELEDEMLETDTQQTQSSNDSEYPVWVYILSGMLGTIVTLGALYYLSRRMN